MDLVSQLKSFSNFQALVIAQDHANCDSLPLRYGLHFENDTFIDLTQVRYLHADYQYPDRHHIEARFQGAGGQLTVGHFVIGRIQK
jgi:hypothetical protein